MSDDLALSLPKAHLSTEEIISIAREAIAREASRDIVRRNAQPIPLDTQQGTLQRPGVTLDLGHKKLVNLPDEIIDIIKDEIERYDAAYTKSPA
jgi:hypothetical protein